MLSHKMDFNCCANSDGFRIDSHIYGFFGCICFTVVFDFLLCVVIRS